jgi:hypothetical protein
MTRHTRFLTLPLMVILAVGLAWLHGQQTGPDPAYSSQPGGTPEHNLWQILILFGAGDNQPSTWNGRLSVESGDVHAIDEYRFEPPDRILPQGGWEIRTQATRILKSSPVEGSGAAETRVIPKGLLVRGAGPGSRLSVSAGGASFSVHPANLRFDEIQRELGGRVEIRRIPPATDLSGTRLREHDFPSIAADPSAVWATWSSFHGGQEELNFRRYQNGRWTRLIPVGRASADLWRPHAVTDDAGKPWLIWSQQVRNNWDIYAMAWEDNEWGAAERLTSNPLPDIEPHVARGADGAIYVVWQAFEGRQSHIRLRFRKGGKWSSAVAITSGPVTDWEPAVAAGADGRVWIVWDRYTSSYDVFARSFTTSGGLSPEMKVASTPRFEAHSSVAVDSQSRPWIAFETGGVNWGKDLGAALGTKSPGHPLGGSRNIEVLCLDGGVWKAAANLRHNDTLAAGSTGDYLPLLHFDPDGNLWMAYKRRFSTSSRIQTSGGVSSRPSIFWETYLARLDGNRWRDPMPLPNSWTRNSTRMGLASAGDRLWAFWPSDSRSYAFASRPLGGRVYAGSITLPGKSAGPQLSDYAPKVEEPRSGHAAEPRDVATIRGHRIQLEGQTLRILRGDLHRHTELSQDIGGLDDGSLPEFYRYMIDAAAMDFGASTDHQGGGADYWNFLTQKMADMYHFPERFVTLYAYERNIGNPDGHRNIIHTRRNYPVVPFFQKMDAKFLLPDTPDGELLTFNSMAFGGAIRNDTKLLYEELRKTRGIAIPHTSGTNSMGTDWRDNDPKIDAVVEIYQGARQNYEHKNAPRGVKEGEESKAIGGFQEPGMVWNAWKKGYKIGVIASSDHYSTHISYAMVYTPAQTRQAIFDSILRRHTYGATDNIVLEFWLGDRFMGDDFAATEPQTIKVKVIGTAPVEAIHLIRDGKYIHKTSPGTEKAEMEYRDNDAGKGRHWYYVRVEQRNGELAWSSPIWVRY